MLKNNCFFISNFFVFLYFTSMKNNKTETESLDIYERCSSIHHSVLTLSTFPKMSSTSKDGICQHYVIKFVSDLQQFSGFLRFPPPIKLTTTFQFQVNHHWKFKILDNTRRVPKKCILFLIEMELFQVEK
jgi:hypothetical protein